MRAAREMMARDSRPAGGPQPAPSCARSRPERRSGHSSSNTARWRVVGHGSMAKSGTRLDRRMSDRAGTPSIPPAGGSTLSPRPPARHRTVRAGCPIRSAGGVLADVTGPIRPAGVRARPPRMAPAAADRPCSRDARCVHYHRSDRTPGPNAGRAGAGVVVWRTIRSAASDALRQWRAQAPVQFEHVEGSMIVDPGGDGFGEEVLTPVNAPGSFHPDVPAPSRPMNGQETQGRSPNGRKQEA